MSGDEFREHEKAIDYQTSNLGVPSNAQLANNYDVVYVHAYKRDDGTKVKAHYRSKPGEGSATDEAGSETGGASNVTPREQIEGMLYQNTPFMPDAKQNLRNAMNEFSEAKRDPHATIINSFREVKNQNVRDVLQKSGIKPDERGIYYNENSTTSQNIAKSPEINDFINANTRALKNGDFKYGKINFDYNRSKDGWDKDKANLHYAFGNVTLYRPHIDKDGYFTAYLIDRYDFDYRQGRSLSNHINNWGYSMQEKGELENHFTLVYIRKKID